jgi:hypothetical protein
MNKAAIKAALRASQTGAYLAPDLVTTGIGAGAGETLGTATDPFVIYSPAYNDGGGADDAILNAMCMAVDEEDIEDTAAVDLGSIDDLSASVTVSGSGLILQGGDDDDVLAFTADEADWGTSYSDDLVTESTGGVSFCVTVNDDDIAVSGNIVVKINGTTVADFFVVAIGPATSITLTSNVGTWVAQSAGGTTVAYAGSVTFRDAAGKSLRSFGIADPDIEDYLITGAEFDASTGSLGYYVDNFAVGDDESADASTGTAIGVGSALRWLDVTICDDAETEIGDTVSVRVMADKSDDGDVDSSDVFSNTLTFKCSADGTEAEMTGATVASSSLTLGGVTAINFAIEDGYGNPLGTGAAAWDVDFDLQTDRNAVAQSGAFFPAELDSDGDYSSAGAALFEDADGDGVCEVADYTAGDVVDDATDIAAFTYDGVGMVCYRASLLSTGTHSVQVSVPDTTAWGAATAATYTLSVNVSGVASGGSGASAVALAVGPKKKTATITISAAAGKLVTVTIEKVSTGKTFTYYRKANASGVAKFTIRRAGTWEVFASYGDLVTDTGRLQK